MSGGVGTEWGVEERPSTRAERREELGSRPWPGRSDAVPWGPGAGGRPRVKPCVSCALLQDYYYLSVKALYTVGYSTSLVTLTTAMVILCRFR